MVTFLRSAIFRTAKSSKIKICPPLNHNYYACSKTQDSVLYLIHNILKQNERAPHQPSKEEL